jgi:hypothetical protein
MLNVYSPPVHVNCGELSVFLSRAVKIWDHNIPEAQYKRYWEWKQETAVVVFVPSQGNGNSGQTGKNSPGQLYGFNTSTICSTASSPPDTWFHWAHFVMMHVCCVYNKRKKIFLNPVDKLFCPGPTTNISFMETNSLMISVKLGMIMPLNTLPSWYL